MENKLIQTGNWYWRTGEISLKDYYKLSPTDRRMHVEFLLKLNETQRSSNDKTILLVSRAKELDKFFEL